MKGFLFALQFLTIIPVKMEQAEDRRIKEAIIYFPLVGLLIGLVLTAADRLLSCLNPGQLCINTMLLILLALLTGGLHLDGLADTFDAISSGKKKEEMLKIMRDPHIGTMGTLSLFLTVILEIVLLSAISIDSKRSSLLLMCVLSRWSMALAMFLFPYARQEGKAQAFFKNTNFKNSSLALAITLFLIVTLWQLKGILILGASALGTYLAGKFISGKIGGITGDTLGAMNELVEVIVLFGICTLERGSLWII